MATPPRSTDGNGSAAGLAVLLGLDEPGRSVWAAAADSLGTASAVATRTEEARVYAEGNRSVCVVAPAEALASEPAFAAVADPAFRRVALIALASTPDAVGGLSRIAFACAALTPTTDVAAQLLAAGLAEADSRRAEWDLVDDYHRRHASLTPEELVVHDAVCQGKLNKQIARELGVSIRTVEQRRRRVFAKMGVASAVPLVDRMATVRTLQRRVDRHGWTPLGLPAPHLMADASASSASKSVAPSVISTGER